MSKAQAVPAQLGNSTVIGAEASFVQQQTVHAPPAQPASSSTSTSVNSGGLNGAAPVSESKYAAAAEKIAELEAESAEKGR